MQYETIILELLSRIKVLEDEVNLLKQKVENISAGTEDEDENEEDPVDTDGSENMKRFSKPRKKMTDEMNRICYEYGKKVSEGKNAQEMADEVVQKTEMNRNSALMYLYAVSGMLDGTVYKRAINAKATRKYFDYILQEYGQSGLDKALDATRQHIKYRKECGLTPDAIETLCDEYEQKE